MKEKRKVEKKENKINKKIKEFFFKKNGKMRKKMRKFQEKTKNLGEK